MSSSQRKTQGADATRMPAFRCTQTERAAER